MKKKFLLFVSLFLASSLLFQAHGQGEGKLGKIFFGGRAGFNSSYMSKSFFNLTRIKTGINAGIYLGYSLSDEISVSIEPMYSQIGTSKLGVDALYYNAESLITNNITRMDLRIHSISLPVIGTYYIKGSGITPKFFGGIAYDYNQWAYAYNTREYVNPFTNQTSLVDTYDEVDKRIQDNGVSGIIGAGIVTKAGQLNLSFDLRGTFGFDNLNATSQSPLYNRSIAFTIGIGL